MSANQTNAPLPALQADAIAQLLNTRNQLTVQYTRERVRRESADYILRLSEVGDVIACVQVKMAQWYQAEVLHLTVDEAYEHKGHAKALLCEAERAARTKDARILQCTIRADNAASRKLFEGFGFVHTSTFLNQGSGNIVGVFQKVLANAR
jgi:ribosomal protein S18 acetylase RimI-like enzyme